MSKALITKQEAQRANGQHEEIDEPVESFPDDDRWRFEITEWNIGMKRAINADIITAGKENDEGYLFKWIAKWLKAWPYEGLEPDKPESYDKLTEAQFNETWTRLLQAVDRFRTTPV